MNKGLAIHRAKRRNRHPDRVWLAKHPEFTRAQSAPIYPTAISRQLRAHNDFFTGDATFQRLNGLWTCVATDPSLKFLKGLDSSSAKFELIKRGFSWQWEQRPNNPGRSKSHFSGSRSNGKNPPGRGHLLTEPQRLTPLVTVATTELAGHSPSETPSWSAQMDANSDTRIASSGLRI
jgi:hypothetical protein